MRVVLAGLLLAACVGCGDDGDGDGEPFRVFHLEAAIGPPGDDGPLRCGPPRTACPGVVMQPPPRIYRYRVRGEPALTSEDVDRSTARRGTDPESAMPFVSIGLTPAGRRAFARLTKRVARVGGRDQGWHHVAVVVGDEIVAFPEIDFDLYPDGVPNASGVQFAAAGDADARDLVGRLRGR